MNWQIAVSLAGVMVALVGLNFAGLRWMLDRRDARIAHEEGRVEQIEKLLYDFKASLPLEYVRREDWIRFSGTLDAKLDQMRDEFREELGGLKTHLYG